MQIKTAPRYSSHFSDCQILKILAAHYIDESIRKWVLYNLGLPGGSVSKESACNAGDSGSVLGSGRSPGENGNPLQYSCLENPMDRGGWWATVHGVAKSWTCSSD